MESRKFIKLVAYSVIVIAVALVFFNEISKVYFLKNENETIEKRIADLKSQNNAYREEIKSIKQDEKYLEKMFREELGMIKEREKIFRFEKE